MKFLLFLSVITFTFFFCKTPKEQTPSFKETIITGEITDRNKYPNTRTISLNPLDGDHYPEYLVDENGKFEMVLQLSETQEFELDPFRSVYFLVEPGDSVHIKLRIDDISGVQFSGRQSYDNGQLVKYYVDGYFAENPVFYDPENPEDFLNIRDSSLNLNMAALDRFSQKYRIGAKAVNKLRGRIQNQHYNQLYDFAARRCDNLFDSYNPEELIEQRHKYFQFVRDVRQDAHKGRGSYGYSSLVQRHLYYFFNFEFPGLIDFPPRISDGDHLDQLIDTIIKHETSPELRSQMIFEVIDDASLYGHFTEDWYPENRERIAPHLSSEQISNLENTIFGLATSDSEVFDDFFVVERDFQDPMIMSLFDMTDAEVIYVDIWATFCQGCYLDILNSQQTIENDFNDIPIDFFFLCSGNEAKFSDFIRNNSLAGHHIFLQNNQRRKLFTSLRFHYVPYKIIVRRDGALVRLRPGVFNQLDSRVLQEYINSFTSGTPAP